MLLLLRLILITSAAVTHVCPYCPPLSFPFLLHVPNLSLHLPIFILSPSPLITISNSTMVNATHSQALRSILQAFPKVRFCLSYGSGSIPQKGYDYSDTSKVSIPPISLLISLCPLHLLIFHLPFLFSFLLLPLLQVLQ